LLGLGFEPRHYHPWGSRAIHCWLVGVNNLTIETLVKLLAFVNCCYHINVFAAGYNSAAIGAMAQVSIIASRSCIVICGSSYDGI